MGYRVGRWLRRGGRYKAAVRPLERRWCVFGSGGPYPCLQPANARPAGAAPRMANIDQHPYFRFRHSLVPECCLDLHPTRIFVPVQFPQIGQMFESDGRAVRFDLEQQPM